MKSGITENNINYIYSRVIDTANTDIPLEVLHVETATTPFYREYEKGGAYQRIARLFSTFKQYVVILVRFAGKMLAFLNQSGGEIDVNRMETKGQPNLKSRLPGL